MSDIYEHDQMIVLETFLANVVVAVILILLIIIIKLGSNTDWFFSLKIKY